MSEFVLPISIVAVLIIYLLLKLILRIEMPHFDGLPFVWASAYMPVTYVIASYLPISAKLESSIYLKLEQANWQDIIKPRVFLALQLVFGGIALSVSILLISLNDVFAGNGSILLTFFGLTGAVYPLILLNRTIKVRHKKIARSFPFFLDLYVLVLRSGLSIPSGLKIVAEVMPAGPLQQELNKLLVELRTGRSPADCFGQLSVRVQQSYIKNFVLAVNQSIKSGGELANALIIQSEQNLNSRFLLAEKLANQAPVKMLLPLVLFLFPLTLLVVLFPVLVQLIESGLVPLGM